MGIVVEKFRQRMNLYQNLDEFVSKPGKIAKSTLSAIISIACIPIALYCWMCSLMV
jgi:hypothetical protein